jgi:rhodanese-related sulfurtransferase
MAHNPGFLAAVEKARKRIQETDCRKVKARLDKGETFHFIDVREDSEWALGRAAGAVHLGKGVLERDIESIVPDKNAPIVLYCGGGFRSAIAAAALLDMGYKTVESMDGGIRAWRELGLPEDKD